MKCYLKAALSQILTLVELNQTILILYKNHLQNEADQIHITKIDIHGQLYA